MESIIANPIEVEEPNDVKVIGRLAKWYRVMREAGLTYDDLQAPITDSDFRQRLVRNWQSGALAVVPPQLDTKQHEQPVARAAIPEGLFIPGASQLEAVRQWNIDRSWGFTNEDFLALGLRPEHPLGANPLTTIVLEVSLDTIGQTFEEAWQLAVAAQDGCNWRWDAMKSDEEHLRLLSGINHQRGLKWRVTDLAANWDRKDGIRPKDVRSPQQSPHSAILWAAALFPKWIQAMDGMTVPYVSIPGYEVKISSRESWSLVPRLHFNRDVRGVRLDAVGGDGRGRGWAVPESRE